MTGSLQSLLMKAKPFLGHELASFPWRVEEGQITQFRNSLLVDGADFISKREIPLTYSMSMNLWGIPHLQLLKNIGLDTNYLVHGEQSFELIKPLLVGHSYIISQILSDLLLKRSSKFGHMLLLTIQSVISDSQGTIVIRQNHTSIQLGKNE